MSTDEKISHERLRSLVKLAADEIEFLQRQVSEQRSLIEQLQKRVLELSPTSYCSWQRTRAYGVFAAGCSGTPYLRRKGKCPNCGKDIVIDADKKQAL